MELLARCIKPNQDVHVLGFTEKNFTAGDSKIALPGKELHRNIYTQLRAPPAMQGAGTHGAKTTNKLLKGRLRLRRPAARPAARS